LTYQQLNRQANQLAHHLQSLGVGAEVLVAICMQRDLLMLVGILGILKAGGAYLPLDPTYPQERLKFMLKDAGKPLLLSRQGLAEGLQEQANLICLDRKEQLIASQSRENPSQRATAENLAYIIYTSGSTGQPKGIMIPHRGLTNYLTWAIEAYKVKDGNGAPVHSSISFDLSITSLFAPLLVGRKVELLPAQLAVEALSEALRHEKNFSLVKITPSHLELLTQQLSPEESADWRGAFIIGGEALSADLIQAWQERAPKMMLVNEYGPTETVVGCSIYKVPKDQPHHASIPIGRPIANTQLYVLDQQLEPVPIGVPGELYIGGRQVARGYLNRPELTAQKFIPNPFVPYNEQEGNRLYKTGDLVRHLADGNLEFLGRIDHQVKIRGFRIELGEIEAILSQHRAVRECVVIVRDIKHKASANQIRADQRLVAYIVPASVVCEQGKGQLSHDLRTELKKHVPLYMLPSQFIYLSALPLTPNGKIDRQALQEANLRRAQDKTPNG
jgi:amino acid adenylation domain-containing protein